MKLILIAAVALFATAVREFAPDATGASATALAAGVLLLAGFFAGGLFKMLGLPKLTGYLAAGIVFGPHVLDVVSSGMLKDLNPFKGVAVALLALTAGLEMHVPTIRPLFRSVRWILTLAVLGTTLLLIALVFFAAPLLPFLDGLETAQLIGVAVALGIALSAQSPAVVVAVRDEVQADGPLVKTVLAVVVFADLIVIVIFGIATTVGRSTFGESTDLLDTVLTLGWHVGGSVLIGAVLGGLIALFSARIEGGSALFIAAVAFVIAEVGDRLHLDPLVLALTAGIVIRNFTPVADRVHHAVEAAGYPVYIAFFAIAGAGVHLDSLAIMAIPATLIVLVRAAGYWTGTWAAARIAEAPAVVGRLGGFGLMPQAGLALALAALFAQSFPSLGSGAGDLVFSVVAMNEMIAPIVFRIALLRSGEAGRLKPHDPEPPSPLAHDPFVIEPPVPPLPPAPPVPDAEHG